MDDRWYRFRAESKSAARSSARLRAIALRGRAVTKHLERGSVALTECHVGVGLFWAAAAENGWAQLMNRSARHVDDDATTREYVRPVGPPASPPAVPRRDGLWDVNDVARYLKVSRSWVYHRAEAGLLPYRRVGGLLRFEPDQIRALR
jgi:excisionase family DNA binding protein